MIITDPRSLAYGVDKQGISKRFLNYFHSLDASLGARTLGPDQTISGKVQSTVTAATQQARTVDEHRGLSKTAHDVGILLSRCRLSELIIMRSIIPKPSRLLLVRKFAPSTPPPPSKCLIYTRRHAASR